MKIEDSRFDPNFTAEDFRLKIEDSRFDPNFTAEDFRLKIEDCRFDPHFTAEDFRLKIEDSFDPIFYRGRFQVENRRLQVRPPFYRGRFQAVLPRSPMTKISNKRIDYLCATLENTGVLGIRRRGVESASDRPAPPPAPPPLP